MKKIYISGAITNNPNYKEQFAAAEAELTAAGYEAFNPAKNTGNSYKEYIDKGLLQEMQCEAIYMLPGHEYSIGATLELQYAEAVNMEIIYAEGATMKKKEKEFKNFIAFQPSIKPLAQKKTIEIDVEEFARLKDIETRFAIFKECMIKADYCPIHHQIILGIENESGSNKELEIPEFLTKKCNTKPEDKQ